MREHAHLTRSGVVANEQGEIMGGRKTTGIDRWDLAPLIESIEALGWRLEHLEHVWAQTEHNAALGKAAHIRGVTIAHMSPRKTR